MTDLCAIGSELHRLISESAYAPNRTLRERRETQKDALEAFTVHVQTCAVCGSQAEQRMAA